VAIVPKDGCTAAERATLSPTLVEDRTEWMPLPVFTFRAHGEMTEQQSGMEEQFIYAPLVGKEEAVVDDKGRLRLSVKKVDRLGQPFVAHADAMGCLVLYPLPTWRARLKAVLSRPAGDWQRDFALHDLCAMAEDDIKCDQQGRFVIPQRFRESLNLTGEVIVVGCGDCVQVWKKSTYEDLASKRLAALKRKDAFVSGGEDASRE